MQNNNKKLNLKMLKITNADMLDQCERENRRTETLDYMPWANGSSYKEIAEVIIKDKNGPWSTPLLLVISKHKAAIGISNINRLASEYIDKIRETAPIDVLSISSGMDGNKIKLIILLRPYNGSFDFVGFFKQIGDDLYEIEEEEEISTGNLIIPQEIQDFKYTPEQIKTHEETVEKQLSLLEQCNKEKPFLNALDKYEPKNLPMPSDNIDLIYDLKTNDMKLNIITPYEEFNKVFQEIMTYCNGIEYYRYARVMSGEETEESFMDYLESYIQTQYVNEKKFEKEDVPEMLKKLYRSLFQFYVVQDLVDDPQVTDIKITAPDSIRARIKGQAYISNIEFIDDRDYLRFVNGIAIKNHISQNVPSQTFTDIRDENYIIRFSLTAGYVNSSYLPNLHIRKIDRNKPLADDLIEAGMMDEKLRDYLRDCAKNSRGVVFAGPPGSGKTICLNWFLEEYEQSAEILVIQENDELFSKRKGIMFWHVVDYATDDEQPVNLEQLGQLALVAGANVFVIGEAKGAEICSAMTLSNSGCRTAITIHSNSSTDTIDKMADLAMRGYAKDIVQAKRMLRSFQTVVYIEKFKIKEITEILGYDEATQDMKYRYIYRRE